MDTPTFQRLAAERARLDDLIVRLEREPLDMPEIINLKRQRNDASPISVLPTDLLLCIFCWCRDTAEETMDWITAVTHVCYYWRETALASGSLWSKPDFSGLDLGAEMVRRSGESPLDVSFGGYNRYENEIKIGTLVADTLGSEAHRIRIVHLTVSDKFLYELWEKVTSPAPLLLGLTINVASKRSSAAVNMPSGIFAGSLSNLHELSLSDCNFDFNHARYDNLTLLSITYIDLRSAAYFHSMLKSMPWLKELYISKALLSSSPQSYDPPVEIPSLSQIMVKGTIDCVVAILSCIKCSLREFHLPATLGLLVEFNADRSSASLDDLTKMSAWVSLTVRVPLTGLAIHGESGTIRVYGFTDDNCNVMTRPPLDLKLNLPHTLEWRHVEALISDFSLSQTRCILIGCSKAFTSEAGCLSLFARARNTGTLTVSGEAAPILAALRQKQAVTVLPELREIKLRYVNVMPHLDLWADVLQCRLPQGNETVKALLALRGCAPHTPQMNALVSKYPRVEFRWDGKKVKRQLATKAARRI